MTKIVALRARAKNDFAEREGVKLSYLPFIARAFVEALKAYPKVNASTTRKPRRSPTRTRSISASRSIRSRACCPR